MGLTRREFIEALAIGGAGIAARPMAQVLRSIPNPSPSILTLAEKLDLLVDRYPFIDSINVQFHPDKMSVVALASYTHTPKHPTAMFASELDEADVNATIDLFAEIANTEIKRLVI